MSKKRYSAEEVVARLRQVDVLTSQGRSVADAIRTIGVSEVSSGTSSSMVRSSTASPRPRFSSRAGADTTIQSDRTRAWATSRRHPRRSSRHHPWLHSQP
jgi:hypothetical protein